MKNVHQEHLPKIPLTTLATLCFVTLVMCQTRFKISKEINRETCYDPPIIRSKEFWFLYTIGNPDSFKCVLKIFVVITSPVLSLISTALLLLGKMESNPYFFIPWLFLTMKGLLLVQTENLITILRDMSTRANYTFGFRMEDLKWILFYITIFMIDLVETFSFCEIFDIFLALWNHRPKYNLQIANIEAVKKDIADIMKSFSKCSLGSMSKMSLGSTSDSDATNESNIKELENLRKLFIKEDENSADPPELTEGVSKGNTTTPTNYAQSITKNNAEEEFTGGSHALKPTFEGDSICVGEYEKILSSKEAELTGFDVLDVPKVKLKTFTPVEVKQEFNKIELRSELV